MGNIYLVNESPYLATAVSRHSDIRDGIILFSTGGFLFDYVDDGGGAYTPIMKMSPAFRRLESIGDGDTVYLSTDLDPAGELIASEAVSVMGKGARIKRVVVPFESMLGKTITVEWLEENSTDKIDIGLANAYLRLRKDGKITVSRKIAVSHLLSKGADGKPVVLEIDDWTKERVLRDL